MKEVYLAYFDFMGFKNFILNNEDEVLMRRMGHIFSSLETCLSKGTYHPSQGGMLYADISQSKLNSLNISDTILLWSNDLSNESLLELIEVAYAFNWRQVTFNFPLRGAVVKGNIRLVSGRDENPNGGSYSVQCLYGKGLVYAHDIAENQEWAGTIIDETVFDPLNSFKAGKDLLGKYVTDYNVPLKYDQFRQSKVFKLKQGPLNEESLKNSLDMIDYVFALDNKGVDNESVQRKIKNTKDFLIYTKDLL